MAITSSSAASFSAHSAANSGGGAGAGGSPPVAAQAPPPAGLLQRLRESIRYQHYSIRTEDAYVHWVRAFLRFHRMRHPRTMGAEEAQAFLTWLAAERKVSVSTHRQALSALVYLYRHVLGQDLPWLKALERPQVKPRLPVVLTTDEVRRLVGLMEGTHSVLARLLYGTGMRIAEALQLRTKDVDFERQVVVVRCGKGGKDRVVMLPASLQPALKEQFRRAHLLWQADAREGRAGVQMPDALERKYPRAGSSWAWFWVFPQDTHSTCPRSTTMVYTHVLEVAGGQVKSPLDRLQAV